jgi:hypothetical protein
VGGSDWDWEELDWRTGWNRAGNGVDLGVLGEILRDEASRQSTHLTVGEPSLEQRAHQRRFA